MTEKALHRLDDGRAIESVLMRYPARGPRRERATVCISSQAGCAVGCPFCATGELGFWRDLDDRRDRRPGALLGAPPGAEGRRVTNVVFMGMGEPLLNAEAVLEAAAALSDSRRFGLGARHITISTSGVVPGIEALTAARPQYTLAVSLHAARPALRDLLVPLNRRWPAAQVVEAASDYAAATGRRVTYEYVMIDGINDTHEDAVALAALLRGQLAHVNLIPMNPVAHTPWQPERARAHRGLRRRPARCGPADDRAPQPRHRDRGGLRAAGGRAGRAAHGAGGGAPPRAAGRTQRRGALGPQAAPAASSARRRRGVRDDERPASRSRRAS